MNRMKRAISVLLAVVMIFTASPVSVKTAAAEMEESILIYEDYQYTVLSDGTVSICGYTGTAQSEMENTYLEIPAQVNGIAVTQIALEAFADNEEIDTVVLPESVTAVGEAAFRGCTDLKAIVLRGTAPVLGTTVAEGCEKLETVLALESCDLTALWMLLEQDLGEEGIQAVAPAQYENAEALEVAYRAYVETLEEALQENALVETTAPAAAVISEAAETTEATETTETTETTEPSSEPAVEIAAEGAFGESLTWKLDVEGTLTISGTGAIPDYYSSSMPWYSYRSSITAVVIENGVTAIGDYAFYQHTVLSGSVTLPETVTTIGSNAFSSCTALTGIVLPQSLTAIGNAAFYNCTGIRGDLILPDTVTEIGSSAFQSCTGLTSVMLPENLLTIGTRAFYNCKGLTGSLKLPNRVTTIGNEAFYNCTGLTGGLTIPATVSSIGNNAFQSCTGLNGALVLESGAQKTIGSCAFYGCSGLTGLQLGEGITSIGSYAFYNCGAMTGQLLIPYGVTTIDSSAFYGCKGLNGDLVIPDSVTAIGSNAFYGCSGFDGTLTLSGNLTTLGSGAFRGCSSITGELVVPAGVTTLNSDVFLNMQGVTALVLGENLADIDTRYSYHALNGMTGLKTVTFNGLTVPGFDSYSPFSYMSGLEAVYVPEASYAAYAVAFKPILSASVELHSTGTDGEFLIQDGILTGYFGEGGVVTVPEDVTAIGDYAFYKNTAITEIVLPEGVVSIGSYAFYQCTGLTGLTLPASLSTIGVYAFFGCTGMTGDLILPEQLSTLGNYTFKGCNQLTSVTFPASLASIGQYTFQSCSGLTAVTFAEGLTEIGQYAFQSCTGLKSLALPASLTAIGIYAFGGCSGLTGDLTVPAAVTAIGDYAFWNCTGLNGTLTLEAGSKTVGNGAFYNCYKLTGLVLGDGITKIGDTAFYNCCSIPGDLVIPNSVTTIGSAAFQSCSGFDGTLTLPSGLTSLGSRAFYQCGGFTGTLTVPEGVTYIDSGTFSEMGGIEALVFGENSVYFYTYNSGTSHPLYGMNSLKEITFNSLSVPTCHSYYSIFYYMTALETVYVPADSYSSYASAFQPELPDGARLISIGADSDFQIEEGVLTAYFGAGGEVTVPEEVTAIADYAFANNTVITKISLPASVTSIGSYAFDGCTGLTEVVFAEGLETIGAYAFRGCTALAALTLPTSLTEIGNYAFQSCSGLTGALTIPENVKTLGSYAFEGCNQLMGVRFPEALTVISQYAFRNCTGLETVTFADGLTEIGQYAFSGCAGLTGLTLPASLVTIGQYAFYNCTGMTGDLTIPATVSGIGNYAFYACTGLNGKLTIEAGAKTIGYSAFCGCKNLTGLELGDGLTSIGGCAFQGCSSITGDLVIPDSVTSIGSSAFNGCVGFDGTLTLPENLKTLESSAFYNCSGFTGALVVPAGVTTLNENVFSNMSGITSLVLGEHLSSIYTNRYSYSNTHALNNMTGVKEVTFTGLTVPSVNSESPFEYMTGLETVWVPAEAYSSYAKAFRLKLPANAVMKSTGATGDFLILDNVLVGYFGAGGEVTVPEEVTAIANYAFAGDTDVTKVSLPAGVVSIGSHAFDQCTGLEKVEFGDGLTSIGEYAFSGCTGLVGALTLPENVTTLGSYAFDGCNQLTGVRFPAALAVISQYAFRNCTGLETVTFVEGLTEIGQYAFYGCTGLKELTLPAGLVTIGQYAFYNCSGMTGSLTIPAAVTSIGREAFSGCTGLNGTLTLEAGPKTMGYAVFSNCNNLTGLVLGDGITSIGDSAFLGCSGMTGTLVIPDSVKTIGNSAFSGCKGFAGTLVLPDNLTSLGGNAFYNCSGITGTLQIPNGVTNIDSGTFSGMSGIEALVFGTTSVYFNTRYSGTSHPLYGMSGLKEITFNSLSVPTHHSYNSIFSYMTALETIWVPAASYDTYVTVFSSQVGENVVITSDFLQAPIEGLAVSHVYSKTVLLTWTPHISEEVIGYTIERDGEIIGTATDCSFTDRGLTAGTAYSYTVYGHTAEGETSEKAELTATTVVPEILDLKSEDAFSETTVIKTVYLYVTDAGNLAPFEGATETASLYYMDGETPVPVGDAVRSASLGSATLAVYTVSWDVTEMADGQYELLFRLTDIDRTESSYRETVTVNNSRPSQVQAFTAEAADTAIELAWAQPQETNTVGYRIYRREKTEEAFLLLTQITQPDTLSYTDSSAVKEAVYYYYIVGVNAYGFGGKASELAAASLTPDEEAPEVTLLSPANNGTLTGTLTAAMTAEDNILVTGTALYISADGGESWTLLAQAQENSVAIIVDTTQYSDGEILIKAEAGDKAGNVGQQVCTYRVDNTGPAQIQGLSYDSTSVSVTLRWDAAAEEDLAFYRVERKNSDGSYVAVTDVQGTAGVNIYGLVPDSSESFRVVGYDLCGNRGIPSEDILATVQTDTTAPEITGISPAAGYYSGSIPVVITASDDHALAAITLQVSLNTISWTDVYTHSFTDAGATGTLSYELPLADYAEGPVYIRGIAEDAAGNQSSSGVSAPYICCRVDRTAPATPEAVEATGGNGYVEIRWEQGSESDLGAYKVYRSDAQDGSYVCIASGLKTLNYFDRTVANGSMYYYTVSAVDVAGNESAVSAAVEAAASMDTEAPVVVTVYPVSGDTVSPQNCSVSTTVTDNSALASVLVEYSKDGESYTSLYEMTEFDSYGQHVDTQIPIGEFADGETVYIRVSARDAAGNASEYVYAQYTVDVAAPLLADAAVQLREDSVYVTWTGGAEADLSAYRVYRKTGETGAYQLMGYCQIVAGQSAYEFVDSELTSQEVTYIYKIEAVDAHSNMSALETEAITLPNRSNSSRYAPIGVISCDTVMAAELQYLFDASASTDDSAIVSYRFDFGDGTFATGRTAVHAYTQAGEYTVILTVTDDSGQETTVEKTVTVTEPATVGTVTVQVKDSNGAVVPGASVYFDLGEASQTVKLTDNTGCVTFTAETGSYAVGCMIADGNWLPAKADVRVTAGAETAVTLTMTRQKLLQGQFEVSRMSYEAIEAAGIDVNDPNNQHIVQVLVSLRYGDCDLDASSFNYNMTTGEVMGGRITYSSGGLTNRFSGLGGNGTNKETGNGSGGDQENGGGGESLGDDRELIPAVMEGSSGLLTVAYLDVPIEASFLKEFFDVRLHILNNASEEFALVDNVAILHLPEDGGLTPVMCDIASLLLDGSSTALMDDIPGQSVKTVTWVLRGDKEGHYDLSAEYSGVLSPFNTQLHADFASMLPLKVYGLSAIKLIAEVNTELNYDAFYFNLSMTNVSDINVNLPSLGVTGDILQTYLREVSKEEGFTEDLFNPEML